MVVSAQVLPASLPAVPLQPVGNPCADGIADKPGTMQVCTMITGSVGMTYTLFTAPLQLAALTIIDAIGSEGHFTTTVGGMAFYHGLSPNLDWDIAMQASNYPPGVRLLGGLFINDVRVGKAVTFRFVCDIPPCDQPAPTNTPTVTWIPPQFRTPTATRTLSATLTVAATPSALPTDTPTSTLFPPTEEGPTTTPVALPSDTPPATASPEPSAVPSLTAAPAPSDTATPIPTGTLTALPTTGATVLPPPSSAGMVYLPYAYKRRR
jgi:hypothetical protein